MLNRCEGLYISSIINWVNPLRPGITLPVSCPQGKGTAQRAEEVGKSERRPVMGRIGVVPFGNITPRESGLTSNGSLITRTSGEPPSEGKADDGRL